MRDQFRSDERITRFMAPVLVMHGGDDSTVPTKLDERLFALAHEPKQFVRIDEGGHDNLHDYGALEAAHRFIHGAKG